MAIYRSANGVTVNPPVFEPIRDDDPRQLGGYALRARLGAGGMGQVFLSFTPGGRPVAVKRVRAEFADDPEFRARFAQEVRAAQQVNGVHIAQLLDAGPDAQPPWLATAYIPGPSLAEAVRLAGPLPVPVVAALAGAIARALQAVHGAGLIHRDLKPGNVVLASDGPRVIDFGVARATDATSLTLSGMRVGSPQYTAPEQIHGQSVTPASDVFALGALLYFAATGRPAFGEGPEFGVVFRIVNEEPPLTGCPPELEPVIRGCLAKDPAARPPLDDVIAASQMPGAQLPPAVNQAIQAREAAVTQLAAEPVAVQEMPTSPGPPGPPKRRRGGWGWRIALAAALLLVGGAVGGKIAYDLADSGGTAAQSGDEPSPQPTPEPTEQPNEEPTTGPSEQPSAAPTAEGTPFTAPGTFQWEGRVRINNRVDLDRIPPQVAPEDDNDTDLQYNSSLNGSDEASIVRWGGPSSPSQAKCADLLSTQGAKYYEDINPDELFCLRTSEGRLALVKVVDETFADVKVWEKRQ